MSDADKDLERHLTRLERLFVKLIEREMEDSNRVLTRKDLVLHDYGRSQK